MWVCEQRRKAAPPVLLLHAVCCDAAAARCCYAGRCSSPRRLRLLTASGALHTVPKQQAPPELYAAARAPLVCVLLRVRVWCGAVFTSRTRRDWILCTTFKSLNGTKITTALRPVTSTSFADTMYSSRSSALRSLLLASRSQSACAI